MALICSSSFEIYKRLNAQAKGVAFFKKMYQGDKIRSLTNIVNGQEQQISFFQECLEKQ